MIVVPVLVHVQENAKRRIELPVGGEANAATRAAGATIYRVGSKSAGPKARSKRQGQETG